MEFLTTTSFFGIARFRKSCSVNNYKNFVLVLYFVSTYL